MNRSNTDSAGREPRENKGREHATTGHIRTVPTSPDTRHSQEQKQTCQHDASNGPLSRTRCTLCTNARAPFNADPQKDTARTRTMLLRRLRTGHPSMSKKHAGSRAQSCLKITRALMITVAQTHHKTTTQHWDHYRINNLKVRVIRLVLLSRFP